MHIRALHSVIITFSFLFLAGCATQHPALQKEGVITNFTYHSVLLGNNSTDYTDFTIKIPTLTVDNRAVVTEVVSQRIEQDSTYLAFGLRNDQFNFYRVILGQGRPPTPIDVLVKDGLDYYFSLLSRYGSPVHVISKTPVTFHKYPGYLIEAQQDLPNKDIKLTHLIYLVSYGDFTLYLAAQFTSEEAKYNRAEFEKFAQSFEKRAGQS